MAGSFSFDTPEEVMHVLASIRTSNIDAAHKNELRDLVLSYTNGGKDPSLLIQIQQQLSQRGVVPSMTPTKLETREIPTFGSSRNTPSFTVPAAPQRPVAPAQPAPTAVDKPAPAPAASVSTPTPEPAPEPETVNVQATDQSAPTMSAPATAPVAEPTPAPAPAAPNPDHLSRIREIKALVNEKVGNPVNLVDIDNNVGREYMAALLDAMKSLNSGADASPAMARLESAYTAVEAVVAKQSASTATVEPAAPVSVAVDIKPAPVPASTPATPVADPQLTTQEPAVSTTTPEPVPSVPTAAPSAPQTPAEPKRYTPPAEPVAPDNRWSDQTIKPVTPPAPSAAPVPTQSTSTPSSVQASTPPAATPVPTPNLTPATPTPAIKPLSQVGERLRKTTDLPTADSINTASKTGDPLYTKEVDDGLNQLLSDWSIFKKSGLFGTGAKGMAHPLYQKIKEVEIPVLLAGRFDGATQEIKQSITDYMNGWRYEQGIIYETGETFEHYLRRVIRHILDLQK